MSLSILNGSQNYYIRGGSDRYFFTLAALLEQAGHRVIPYAVQHSQNIATPWSTYFPIGVNFQAPDISGLARFLYSVPAARNLKALLREYRVDLAHLHIYYGQLTSSILNELHKLDIPVVQTLHEYKLVCPVATLTSGGQVCQACGGGQYWQAVRKRCNRGSVARSALVAVEAYLSRWLGGVDKIQKFITVSNFQRSKLIELGISPEKITTLHNFIDTKSIIPSTKSGHYFLFFGRVERLKGIFTLLEAVAPLTDIPLYIVGTGEALPEVRLYLEEKQLKHVKVLGFKQQPELGSLIAEAICTVAPSEWYETFGLTLIESFAHGRPVIASRIGGMTEVVNDGQDGWLFTPGNVLQLRERLAWMATHPAQAQVMGAAGRAKVETQFSPAGHLKQLSQIYQEIL